MLCAALALGTAVVYAGSLENEFVNFDDDRYVYENPTVRGGLSREAVAWAFSTFQEGNWHPLTWLSLQADRSLFGLTPRAYHTTNLVLHTANTLLLFWIIRLMAGAVGRSVWIAAFFALHPLHVESVAWASERKDVLSTFFLFLCLLSWVAYARRPAVGKYLLSLALFALSLMSKAMGVTLPLVLLLLDFWPLDRWPQAELDRRRQLRTGAILLIEKLPFCLFSGAIAATAVFTQSHGSTMDYGHSIPLSARLLTVPVNYVTYLWQTFWPVDLAVLYPHPGADLPHWKPLGAVVELAAVTTLVLRKRSTRPYLLFGWLWFLIALLPVIGLVQIGGQATADRYMYLPMVGLLIAFCWAAYDLAGEYHWHPAVLAAALAVCLLNCAKLTTCQIAVWHDGVTLWGHALAITPPSLWACNQYGQALAVQGEDEEAEHWFRQALAIDPTALAPNANLGSNLLHQGRPEEAAQYLLIALETRPDDALLIERLGLVEEMQGRLDAALGYYERAAQLVAKAPRFRQDIERVRAQLAKHGPANHVHE
ncbi:MAG TPA: tetratricopeptide repeat protein [Pirellulales bacterium]|nr:tetratricopeptide repeat protein [Pirellulales bacterium]